MDPQWIPFVKGVITFCLAAGTCLGFYWLRLRMRNRLTEYHDDLINGIRDEQAQLRAEVEARVTELEDRLGFAERQLLAERERPRFPAPTKVPTPV